jgi:cholesterol oxidase
MEVLASLGQGEGRALRRAAPALWPRLGTVVRWALRRGLLSGPVRFPGPQAGAPGRMTNLFAIGRDNAGGTMGLRNGRVDIAWDYERENAVLVSRMEAAMRDVAAEYGATFAPILTWNVFRKIVTVHPLGGCRLAESDRLGVVSPEGEAFGCPGLYVADGSLVPTAIGYHPVMTISALAERVADAAVASYAT